MTLGEFFFFMLMFNDRSDCKHKTRSSSYTYSPPSPPPKPVVVDDLGCSHWYPPYDGDGSKLR